MLPAQMFSNFCVFCYQSIYSCTKANNSLKSVNKFTKSFSRYTGHDNIEKLLNCDDVPETIQNWKLHCCNECNIIIDGFCVYYHQLKVLEAKMNFKLEQLAKTIQHCNRMPSRWKEMHASLEENFPDDKEMRIKSLEFMKKFREIIEKTCIQRNLQEPLTLLEPNKADHNNVLTENNTTSLMSSDMEMGGDVSDSDHEANVDQITSKPSLDPSMEVKLEADSVSYASNDEDTGIQNCPNSDSDGNDNSDNEVLTDTNNISPLPHKQQRYSLRAKPSSQIVNLGTYVSDNNNSDDEFAPESNSEKLSSDSSEEDESSQKLTSSKRQKLILKSSKNDSLQCPNCEKTFEEFGTLRRHLGASKICSKSNTVNTETGNLKCAECDLICQTKKLLWEHQNKDHERITCTVCGKEFKTRSVLKRHMLYHVDQKDWRWKCSHCGRKSSTKQKLMFHIARIHKIKISANDIQPQASVKSENFTTKTQERIFRCSVCQKTFQNEQIYHTHIFAQLVDKFQCHFCQTEETNVLKLSTHEYQNHCPDQPLDESSTQSEWSCPRCQYRSTCCADYQYHFAQVHFKFGDPTCEKLGFLKCAKPKNAECVKPKDKKCAKSKNVKCAKPKDKKCEKCDKAFKTTYELFMHRTNVHSSVKLTCEKCGKGFACSKYLNRHLEYHKDRKDWKWECDKCGKKSTTKDHHEKHMRSHLQNAPTQTQHKFVCEICGEKFSYKSNLRRHSKRKHENEECSREDLT